VFVTLRVQVESLLTVEGRKVTNAFNYAPRRPHPATVTADTKSRAPHPVVAGHRATQHFREIQHFQYGIIKLHLIGG